MKELFDADLESDRLRGRHWDTMGSEIEAFQTQLRVRLEESAVDPDVVGFKSIVCYRTGLDVQTSHTQLDYFKALEEVFQTYRLLGTIRLAKKPLNDYVVAVTLEVAAEYKKPGERNKDLWLNLNLNLTRYCTVQFHTGLGDNDITLTLASPAHLQTVIKAFPSTIFVLLHSSYPYTREAGYLTAVYPNVYLDFGEVRGQAREIFLG